MQSTNMQIVFQDSQLNFESLIGSEAIIGEQIVFFEMDWVHIKEDHWIWGDSDPNGIQQNIRNEAVGKPPQRISEST